ncbi:hypothetical protein FGSG_07664 [Fusarium graminearum PH-1]|uniref:hypothetical protein n=1 Tax=Gibberella zeae (strain ATCC MYA-4620 / CBS 123657 / FGSC 9075 / NRRL 31084 / PH-1) TaxID=229533 RepID=UPI00021F203A|nr:hypothetical protein FGSG_07664 [Fusarium graminearum PH-1]ESU13948.1 hypothetical protein FGSG_07664 [Fusarium graminearum PH-1]|eukprot:XP_011327455.1 hypothetical protein FGSG_07664 [Fusarium graminearum PH-1]
MTGTENKDNKGVKKDGDKVEQMLFEIYFVDTSTKAAQLDKIAPVPKIEMDKQLSKVRAHLRANKALSWREASCTFCTLSGAELKDNLTLADYKDLAASQGKEPGAEQDKSKEIVTNVKEDDKKQKTSIKVYFRSLKRNLGLDDKTKEFLKQKMEFELKKAELLPEDERKMLKGSYSHRDFMAEVGTGSIIHPADMTEEQWNSVVETNSLLHGNTIFREAYDLPITVERAMYPGKRRSKVKMEEYRIPRFIVTDDAYVEVSEHKTSVMTAMAESSLSKNSSEVAIGGGAFGWSGGVTGGHEYESSERSRVRKEEEKNHMIITYNFPRVTLNLDDGNLELTQECKKELATVKTREDAGRFKRKFGCFFSTKVQLGGRLHSTQESTAVTGSTTGEKSKRLKITAAASFAGPAAEVTVKGGYGEDSTRQDQSATSTYDSHMAWEAKGGDTLLCNKYDQAHSTNDFKYADSVTSPSAWCSTVSSYYNWRQDNVISIEDIISQVAKDQEHVFEKLKKFEERASSDSLDICFYHKATSRYLGFNTAADSVPGIMFADLYERGDIVAKGSGSIMANATAMGGIADLIEIPVTPREYGEMVYAMKLGRGPRKTLSLGGAQQGNAQVFQLSGKVVKDEKGRLRLMKQESYEAWNADVNCPVGYVPATETYKRTQLQECYKVKKEEAVSFRCKPVIDQTAQGLAQEIQVVIEAYSGTEFLGHLREAEGHKGAVVVDRGPKDKFHGKDDIKAGEPLQFTLRYQPYSDNGV